MRLACPRYACFSFFTAAMLIYRVFRFLPKLPLKAVHAVLMLLSLLFSVVGLKSAFDSHNLRGIPNMYSLHSWIGLITVVLFALQVRQRSKSAIKMLISNVSMNLLTST